MRIALAVFASAFVWAFSVPTANAAPFRPNLGPDLEQIKVRCGDVTLLLRQKSQWTPGRFDFLGTPMTTERSAYGTVFMFPDVGFIGTAHLENEPENLQSLAFILDGKKLGQPQPSLTGRSFRFERESRIRNFILTSVTEVKVNRIYETATISTKEAAPLKLVYNFMHAWTPTVSAYLAGSDDLRGREETGALSNDKNVERSFVINCHVDWVAVYEPASKHFAVSRLLEAPEQGGHVSKIWNVPGTYQKYYLKSFVNQTVPAGFNGTWRMVTAFGKSDAKNWRIAAREMAWNLRELK